MKRILSILSFTALLAVSCQEFDNIWDKIDNLDGRVGALEEKCERMNTNITSLQTLVNALESKDYITGVTSITENGEVIGYEITFTGPENITIFHGRDGKNGNNGKDGKDGKDGKNGKDAPVIGVAPDANGNYCWTLDGEFLTDDKGVPIGAPGADGKDGVTPQLKVEDGFWYVSYDGENWTKLGPALGPQGDKGDKGDSMFSDVDFSNPDFVIFTLADGTVIKIPTWYAFETLKIKCNEMNTNIVALQRIVDALQNNVFVTSVIPVIQDGKEVGYTINFSKGAPVTIFHGKDGADGSDGTDGADGSTPMIGVKADTDGVYYWTVNGEWLLDAAGQKISAEGKTGAPGAPGVGTPGAPGKDGVTPQLKIEDGSWFVSYDGVNWTELGRATGPQGPQGPAGPGGESGTSGDSMFSSVDASNPDFVIFTLAGGTVIKLPTWAAFDALRTLCNQMNTNITALQRLLDALQQNLWITSVVPVIQDGKEIGYTINFSKGNPVTILHGTSSTTVPMIGAKEDTDGVFYWTVDGEWLLDISGQKVPASGRPGKDGENGITPQFKIERGYWFISYDGVNWTLLGQATGDQGPAGTGGSGDGLFTDVYVGKDFVVFTLANGITFSVPASQGIRDLSRNGTANCYIVSKSGRYKFMTVEATLWDSRMQEMDLRAEVLWESFDGYCLAEEGGLVYDAKVSDGYVYFSATNYRGNALIAVRDAESGEIVWSWHIWMTDSPTNHPYINDNGYANSMLDRNLGATSAGPGKDSFGLYYQWGRKDPFLWGVFDTTTDSKYYNETFTTHSEVWKKVASDSSTGNIMYATGHPTTFITVNPTAPYDWYFTGNTTRWGSEKTMYDPCPYGYKVPDGGIYTSVWEVAFGTSARFQKRPSDDPSGLEFGGGSDSPLTRYTNCWYPLSGYMAANHGEMAWEYGQAYYWTNGMTNGYPEVMELRGANATTESAPSAEVVPSSVSWASQGNPVRCEKINTGLDF